MMQLCRGNVRLRTEFKGLSYFSCYVRVTVLLSRNSIERCLGTIHVGWLVFIKILE